MVKTKITPRGIRNNNPLNIRVGNVWLGEVKNPTDPDFEQFVNMVMGLRAAFVILRRYISRYGKNTIASIISTWAPSSENNTIRYIDVVSSLVGIAPDAVLAFSDTDIMTRLVDAMAFYECGCHVSMSDIQKAYKLA